jgi:hypothetical protein
LSYSDRLNNPTEEKIDGQRSAKKQSRKEETKTSEGQTDQRGVVVFNHAAGHGVFTQQEKIAPQELPPAFEFETKDFYQCQNRIRFHEP